MFNARDYLNKNCLSNLYHTYISHCHLLPLFLTQKINYSVNHILDTFSSYRTYIQIIKYSSTQQSLLSQNWTLMYKLSNGLLPEALNELYI